MKTTRFLMMFVAAAAMMFAACDKDDSNGTGSSNNGGGNGGGSGSAELANTTWVLDSSNDPVYHCDVLYTVTIGSTNEFSFGRNIAGDNTIMGGTYDYANGNGTAYLRYVLGGPDGDNNEYRLTFSVSGNTMNLNYSGRTIALGKR